MASFDEELSEIFDQLRSKMDEILGSREQSSEKIVENNLNEITKQRRPKVLKTKNQKLNLNLIFKARKKKTDK